MTATAAILTAERSSLVGKAGVPMAGLLAGLLLAAGYALRPLWWAPWLAPAILLLPCRTEQDARLAGALAGAGAIAGVLPYYVQQNGWAATAGIALLRVASWSSAAGFALAAARRLPLAWAVFALPAALAGLEAATLALSPHGSAGSLAYSQSAHPELVQVAALGGVPAVVFLLLLPGSLLGLWAASAAPKRQAVAACAAVAVVLADAALFTGARLRGTAAAPYLPVTLVATDRFSGVPDDWDRVWSTYRPAVLAAGSAPGGLVVLPEKLALLDQAGAGRAAEDLARAAHATGATVVAGIEVRDRSGYRNRSLAASPDGRVAWYTKQRLVPGFEDRDRPGRGPGFARLGGAVLGLTICKDMHVPSIGRGYAGADVVAVPAWDFDRDGRGDGWMGARMAAMRAVENGFAVARSARGGLVGAYDRYGRSLAERRVTMRVILVQTALPSGGRSTPYARVGDLFGWLCVAAAVALRLAGWRKRVASPSS